MAKARIRRIETFQATCPRHEEVLDWDGPERTTEAAAARDLALHNIDAHGGTPRGEEA